jgi:uncharacterized protein YjbI with pentapeptide repeats
MTPDELKVIIAKHAAFVGRRVGGVRANLKKAELAGLDFSKAQLQTAVFAGSDCRRAKFVGCDLSHADFFGAALEDANLSWALLKCTDFRGAVLRNARLNGSNMSQSDLRPGIWMDMSEHLNEDQQTVTRVSDLSNASLQSANLSSARLTHALLQNADLSNADLSDSDLSFAKLKNANLANANLTNANLSKTLLKGADLSNCIVTVQQIEMADVTDAVLPPTIAKQLSMPSVHRSPKDELERRIYDHQRWMETGGQVGARADLKGCNLSKRDLRYVDLSGADLTGCVFDGADVSGGKFVLCQMVKTSFGAARLVGTDLSGSDLSDSNFKRANLTRCMLGEVDLKKPDGTPMGRKWPTNLSRCDFSYADLTNATLLGARTEGAVFANAILDGTKTGDADAA